VGPGRGEPPSASSRSVRTRSWSTSCPCPRWGRPAPHECGRSTGVVDVCADEVSGDEARPVDVRSEEVRAEEARPVEVRSDVARRRSPGRNRAKCGILRLAGGRIPDFPRKPGKMSNGREAQRVPFLITPGNRAKCRIEGLRGRSVRHFPRLAAAHRPGLAVQHDED